MKVLPILFHKPQHKHRFSKQSLVSKVKGSRVLLSSGMYNAVVGTDARRPVLEGKAILFYRCKHDFRISFDVCTSTLYVLPRQSDKLEHEIGVLEDGPRSMVESAGILPHRCP